MPKMSIVFYHTGLKFANHRNGLWRQVIYTVQGAHPMPIVQTLVLASASPRRAGLLKLLQSEFEVLPCQVPEVLLNGESPAAMVQRLALAKARAARELRPGSTIIGADTVVVFEELTFGKPASAEEARCMLQLLSGKAHSVLTGVCVWREGNCLVDFSRTTVVFSQMSDQEIAAYLKTGEPVGKAGAYAIQGFASRFVERVEGCYFNVVGLPVSLLYQMLKRAGYQLNG
jgi:septum formation protein